MLTNWSMNGLQDSNNENVHNFFIYSYCLAKPATWMKTKLKRDPT